MIKILLLVAGVLAVVIGAIVAIGYALPVQHRLQRSARLAVSCERVWQTIIDFQNASRWRRDIRSVERLSGNSDIWKEVSITGDAIQYATVESVPNRKLVRKIVSRLPFGGTWTFLLEPASNESIGCTLTIVEDGEVYNPVFRLVSKFLLGHDKSVNLYLTELTAHLRSS